MGYQVFDWYGGGSYDTNPWPPSVDVHYDSVDEVQRWGEANTDEAVRELGLTPKTGGALVLGRFDPPHLGHAFLVRAARASSEGKVVVCVFVRRGDCVPGPQRASALRDFTSNRNVEVREVPVDEVFPTGHPDVERWLAWFRSSGLGGRVSRLVSSDANARAFADAAGLELILVDPARRAFPLSATALRADPWGGWEFLLPPVRPFFTRLVGFVGPEGGGKSTAVRQLAKHFQTSWGAEYFEVLTSGLSRSLDPGDVTTEVMRGTLETMGNLRLGSRRFGLVDGDAVNVKLWFERLFPSQKPIELAPKQFSHHTLVFDDHPWTGEPRKDEPAARQRMVEAAVRLLEANGCSYSLVTGPRALRPQRAIEALESWAKTKPWTR